ncbi:MAG: S9 family peptidase [Planctomycetota bacterium]|nr:MAG: S9 family peptidase [Planctomycetota bacterium]
MKPTNDKPKAGAADSVRVYRCKALWRSRAVVGSLPATGLSAVALLVLLGTPACRTTESLRYPPARQVDVVDNYHGTLVADPYRWLEDPDSPETRKWIEAENKLTFSYLEKIPQREPIRRRLTELWNYEKFGLPRKRGNRYIFTRNDGLQNQSVFYVMEGLDGTPRMFLDPNKLSEDGTVAVMGTAVSEDGKRMAYAVSTSGSDWREVRVRDIDTGEDLPDRLQWVKFSGLSWDKEGKGFYYSRYDEPKPGEELQQTNYFQKLYYHRLGTPQSEDVLVYHRPDHKDWGFGGAVTDDGQYLVINVWRGTEQKNLLFYRDLSDPSAEVVELIPTFDASYEFIDNDGPIFWLFTDKDAPRGRVIAMDTRHPDPYAWKEVIPEAKETLRSVNVVGNRFVANYLKDAHSQVKIFTLDGKLEREVDLPGLCTAYGFGGRRQDRETFYSVVTYTDPGTIYRYDMLTGKSTIFRRPKVDFTPEDFVTKQVFYASKDGTRVPMFISYKKGIRLDGGNPTLLYGYGGFNIAITPRFSVAALVWMEMGGVYAVANLRGGGEYGKEWHQAGTKLHKQNVFDDFIAAAEWLIAHRYTRREKLAIEGRSNGGLLVGACMTQRPDLFGCCLPGVGVMDMLRFHKFTIGWAWTSDYGSSENPEEFKALYAYSPYHNIKPGVSYPATLITTADHDDRVVPGHSFKFAARLQAAQAGPAPVLIRIQTKAGHGAGKPTTMRIAEAADVLAFTANALDVPVPPEWE